PTEPDAKRLLLERGSNRHCPGCLGRYLRPRRGDMDIAHRRITHARAIRFQAPHFVEGLEPWLWRLHDIWATLVPGAPLTSSSLDSPAAGALHGRLAVACDPVVSVCRSDRFITAPVVLAGRPVRRGPEPCEHSALQPWPPGSVSSARHFQIRLCQTETG